MRLLRLADDCRAAGLVVVELPGWETAGGELGNVGAVVSHHTATGPTVSDSAVDRLLRYGRSDLPGPLSQVGLDRQGRVHLIASGVANHAGAGSWRGVSGNSRAVGVEAYNSGTGEPWSQAQLDAWDVLNAVLLRTLTLPADAVCGHKEWAPTRKIDPAGLDMDDMRARAASLLTNPQEDDDMPTAAEVWSQPVEKPDRTKQPAYAVLAAAAQSGADASAKLDQLLAVVGGLSAALTALAANTGLTAQEITDAAKAGADAALSERITGATVDLNVTPAEGVAP